MKDTASLASSELRSGQIPGLDGLRAVSVLLVMFGHFGFGTLVPGALGVTIFFFLSGFLITILMLREIQSTGQFRVKEFLIRRSLRLGPELLCLIVVSGLAGTLYVGLPRVVDLLAATLYVSNYYQLLFSAAGISQDFRWPHLWSLAVEQHFYLLYPLLTGLLLRDSRKFLGLMCLVCMLALGWRYVVMLCFNDAKYTYIATETRLDSIVYGCLAAYLLWFREADIKHRLGAMNWEPIGVGAALIMLTLVPKHEPMFRETVRYSLQGVGLIAFVGGLFLTPAGAAILNFLEWRPLQWMGRMSYAAYLWHPEIVLFFDWAAPSQNIGSGSLKTVPFAIFMAGTSFFVAWMSHVAIYKPILRWRRSFGSHAQ